MFNNRCYVISAKEFSKAATIVLLFYSFLTFAVYTFQSYLSIENFNFKILSSTSLIESARFFSLKR